MLYRETGVFKTSYEADQAVLPIPLDKWFVWAVVIAAFAVVPFLIGDYWTNALLLPFLVYSLAAIGLNVLVGYCGQISLGTGAFLGVGAYSSYKLLTAFPDMNIFIVFVLAGFATAAVGMLFGLPSLRIKGFYLAVATLAAQFFIIWLFYKVPWFNNYSATGQITVPQRELFDLIVTGPRAEPATKYLVALATVAVFALVTKNLVRGSIGRSWMAIRDMDIAAELIGIRPLIAKLSAFGVSSFLIGVAGAMMFSLWLGAAEAGETFGIDQSFLVLFMIIIGGLGTILGSFLGAALLVLMPVFLKNIMVDGLNFTAVFAKHVEITMIGVMILIVLILEPHGLARLWAITKEKLRLWPFPH